MGNQKLSLIEDVQFGNSGAPHIDVCFGMRVKSESEVRSPNWQADMLCNFDCDLEKFTSKKVLGDSTVN